MKLNLGSGAQPLEGWENWDGKNGHTIYPLGLSDGSVDEIRASHVLEHFNMRQVTDVLIDWVRALKPGGVLKIAVPDFHWIAQEYLKGASEYPLTGYVMGGQTDENDFHKSLFDESALRHRLTVAGLTDIQPWHSEIKDCAALPVSLNLMGRKPEVKANGDGNGLQFVAGNWYEKASLTSETIKVRPGVILSTPRFGPLDAAEAIYDIASGLGAPRFKSLGCWRGPARSRSLELAIDYKQEWDEGLTEAIEDALAYQIVNTDGIGLDVLITVDFDTYATPDDAKKLIQLLYQNPQYDCVVSNQVRRGPYQEILATFLGQPDFSQALVPIFTGHFGLTVFRRRVFDELRRPWFLSTPAADGGWGEGRTDADIYFWQRFADQGFKAALATQVVVGHGDEGVCWPKIENGKIVKVWQSLSDWTINRKPPFMSGDRQ